MVKIDSGLMAAEQPVPGQVKEEARTVTVAGNPKKTNLDDPGHQVVLAGGEPPVGFEPRNQVVAGSKNARVFDFNSHSTKKDATSGLLDMTLLIANCNMLRNVITVGDSNRWYEVMLTMLVTSIVLQVLTAGLLWWLGKTNINNADEAAHKKSDTINNVVLIGVFLTSVINIFISSFDVSFTTENASKSTDTTSTNSSS